MTTDEDEDRSYTAACVRTALKRYRRTRRNKNVALGVMALIAAAVPWLLKFEGSSILVWYVGILVVLVHGQTEQRLRAMQIRLASMHELLHRIAGDTHCRTVRSSSGQGNLRLVSSGGRG